MKLIFPIYPLFDSSKSPLYIKMALFFQKQYKFDLIAITFGKSSQQYLKKHKEIKWENTYDLQDFLLENLSQNLDVEEAIKLESQYGVPNFGLYATASQQLFCGNYNKKYKYEEIIKIIIAYLHFWERLFKKEGSSIFIDEGIAGLNSTIWKVAEKYNSSVFNLITSRLPNRFVITHHSFDSWDRTNHFFSEVKKRNLTTEEIKKTETFLEQFKDQRLEPPYMKLNKKPPSISLKAPVHFLEYLYQYHFLGEKKNILFQSPYYRIKDKMEKVWRYNLLKLIKIWQLPIEKEKFVLYPLQYQPEASTLVLAPFYLDQLALIKNIAQSLPVDYKLYVKEHPSCVGMRDFAYYRQILKIPNIRLISPWVNTYQVIQKSKAIITITSTVGFESILYEKPVILLGNVFYDIFDLVYKVNDITKLPFTIKEALNNFKPDRELLFKFILSILKGTYEGEIAMPLSYTYSEQNVKNLCQAIIKEINSSSLKTTNI